MRTSSVRRWFLPFTSYSRQPSDGKLGTIVYENIGRPFDGVNGRFTSRNTYRLVQHKGPKLALQVILGIMVLCAAVAHRLVDMRRTLLR